LACSGNTTKSQSVAAKQKVTISTGWTNTCTAVTVGSSNGWDTNFDNFVYDNGGQVPAGDTQAPAAPTNLKATAVSASQINLTWTAATDNVGVTGYEVYRGTTKVATIGNVTSFGDTGLAASTTYSYTVKARDAAGNVSPASAASSATTQATPSNLGAIVGVVKSSLTNAPLQGAWVRITVNGKRVTVITNSRGEYALQGLPAATYSMIFWSFDHRSQTASVTVAAGQTAVKDVTLQHH
jgi:hypothetical protein